MRRDGTVLGESAVGRKLVALTTRRVIILVRRRRAMFSLMEVPQDFHRFPNSIHGWSSKLRHKQTQALSPLSNLYIIFIKSLSNLDQAFSLDTDGLSLSYRYWWCYFACPSRPFWQRLEMMRQTFCIVCQYLSDAHEAFIVNNYHPDMNGPQWLVVLLTESVKIADITSAPFEDISILWC